MSKIAWTPLESNPQTITTVSIVNHKICECILVGLNKCIDLFLYE